MPSSRDAPRRSRQPAAPGGRDVEKSCRVAATGFPVERRKTGVWRCVGCGATCVSILSGVLESVEIRLETRKPEHAGARVSTKPPECGRLGGCRDATDDHGRLRGYLAVWLTQCMSDLGEKDGESLESCRFLGTAPSCKKSIMEILELLVAGPAHTQQQRYHNVHA